MEIETEIKEMLTMEEGQELIIKFIELRERANETKSPIDEKTFRTFEKKCIHDFMYLITLRTARYRNFANYDDLNQEGLEALLKAMKNYNPKKGNFFWWAHKYIDTRIARMANTHTTIRFPLKVAKEITPVRLSLNGNGVVFSDGMSVRKDTKNKDIVSPSSFIFLEETRIPEKEVQKTHDIKALQGAMEFLSEQERKIISMYYGLFGEDKLSIKKICSSLKIPRSICIKAINSAVSSLRDEIVID
jgi:RNA polymerase sigma factor (sigma-70 family)